VYATILAGNNRIEKRARPYTDSRILLKELGIHAEKDVFSSRVFYDSKGSAVSVQYETDWILRSKLLQAGFNLAATRFQRLR
jgi:hypothetical protein